MIYIVGDDGVADVIQHESVCSIYVQKLGWYHGLLQASSLSYLLNRKGGEAFFAAH